MLPCVAVSEEDLKDYQPGNGQDFEALMDQLNDIAIRNQERSDCCPKVYGPKLNEARGRADAFPLAPKPPVSILVPFYNEEEVMWAMATRVQADQDVDIIKNVKGNTLDPSQTDNIMTAKMIIDATKPVQRPFGARVAVPKAALEKTRLEDFIPRAVIDGLPKV